MQPYINKILIIIFAIISLILVKHFNINSPAEKIIEEIAEEVIETQLGIKLDLD